MDYGFTSAEILFLYMHIKKQLEELEHLAAMGHASLAKDDMKLFSSVLKKIESQHPSYSRLPM